MGELLNDLIWRLCNIVFECDRISEARRFDVTIPLDKGKGEKTECKNYRDISLSVVVKNMQGY